MDNLDGLVAEAIVATNESAATISSTMREVGDVYGYQITDNMNSIWNAEHDVVGMYGDLLYGVQKDGDEMLKLSLDQISENIIGTNGISGVITESSTGVQNVLSGINVNINNMIEALNKFAQDNANNIAALQNAVITTQQKNADIGVGGNNQNTTFVGTSLNGNSSNSNNGGQTASTNTLADTELQGNKTPQKVTPSRTQEESRRIDELNAKIKQLNKEIGVYEESVRVNTKDYNDLKTDYGRKLSNSNLSTRDKMAIEREMNSKLNVKQSVIDTANNNILSRKAEIAKYQKEIDSIQYGYAKGSKHISSNRLAWTQEDGQELIYRSSDGSLLTPLRSGDKVFTAEMTDNLWNMANMTDFGFKPISVGSKASNTNVNFNMNISLPGATNYNEFKEQLIRDRSFEKAIQSITIDRALGKNSLSKFK